MKKIGLTLLSLVLLLSLGACQPKEEPQRPTEQEAQEQQQVKQEEIKVPAADTQELVKRMVEKGVDVKQETEKLAEMVKAQEGREFFVSGKRFEVYRYANEKDLENVAKTGFIEFDLEELGKINMNALVNGKFVLAYEEEVPTVLKAFEEA